MTNEAELSPVVYQDIAKIAHQQTGIILSDEKRLMVQSRLRSRLRHAGVQTFEEYRDLITSDNHSQERRQFVSALTTNVSYFFRESHHFEHMIKDISERRSSQTNGPLLIWCAGCSNGQEPYSVAISLWQHLNEADYQNVKILATDIDPAVLEFAKSGQYRKEELRGLSEEQVENHFSQVTSNGRTAFKVVQEIRDRISFRELNLLDSWPMSKQFDYVFCRNVVIYFDQTTQDMLWPRFAERVRESGCFFLGHSERMQNPTDHGFRPFGATAYQKTTQLS